VREKSIGQGDGSERIWSGIGADDRETSAVGDADGGVVEAL
jgi:hypothetical protein